MSWNGCHLSRHCSCEMVLNTGHRAGSYVLIPLIPRNKATSLPVQSRWTLSSYRRVPLRVMPFFSLFLTVCKMIQELYITYWLITLLVPNNLANLCFISSQTASRIRELWLTGGGNNKVGGTMELVHTVWPSFWQPPKSEECCKREHNATLK